MQVYLVIITTALVLTQIIRLIQNTMQLKHLKRKHDIEEDITGDNVNHPKHYTQGEIETIDKIKYLTEDFNGIEAVCIGNFIKYIDRCNLKGGMEDLEKAKWYLDRFLDEFYDGITW